MAESTNNTSETASTAAGRTQGATPGQTGGSGWRVQFKRSIRGRSFAEQETMMSPSGRPGSRDVQRARSSAISDAVSAPADVHTAAQAGVAGAGGPLPHLEAIQASFGRHDVTAVQAHIGGAAQDASAAIGANAYAIGDQVAFAGTPDLHTAAHEATHVVQQRAGVALSNGIGEAGDRYEQHADQVADAVVAGRSVEGLLAPFAAGGGGAAVQRDGKKIKNSQKGKGDKKKDCPHQDIIDEWDTEQLEEFVRTDGENTGWSAEDLYKDLIYADKVLKEREGDSSRNAVGKAEKDLVDKKKKSETTYSTEVEGDQVTNEKKEERTDYDGTTDEKTRTTTYATDDAGDEVESVEEEEKNGQKEKKKNVETKTESKIVGTGDSKEKYLGGWEPYEDTKDLGWAIYHIKMGGPQLTGSYNAEAGVTSGGENEGIYGTAAAGGGVLLGSLEITLSGKTPWGTVGGEDVRGSFELALKGMAGIEGAAQAEAVLGKIGQQAGPDVDASGGYGLALNAGGEAFAGAKLGVIAGLGLEWNKKGKGAYTENLDVMARKMLEMASSDGGIVGSAYAALINTMGLDQLVAGLVEDMVEWGPGGPVTLLLAQGKLEGSVGVGLSGKLSAGFQNGKISFSASGGFTVGLGLGGGVDISLDAIQGPLFLLIFTNDVLGDMVPWVKDKLTVWLPQQLSELDEAVVAWAEEGVDNVGEIAEYVTPWGTGDGPSRLNPGVLAKMVIPIPHHYLVLPEHSRPRREEVIAELEAERDRLAKEVSTHYADYAQELLSKLSASYQEALDWVDTVEWGKTLAGEGFTERLEPEEASQRVASFANEVDSCLDEAVPEIEDDFAAFSSAYQPKIAGAATETDRDRMWEELEAQVDRYRGTVVDRLVPDLERWCSGIRDAAKQIPDGQTFGTAEWRTYKQDIDWGRHVGNWFLQHTTVDRGGVVSWGEDVEADFDIEVDEQGEEVDDGFVIY